MHQQKNPILQQTTQGDIESVIKEINKADSVDELMGIYKEASTKFDKVSLAKLKTYLTDRKNELEA
jgi:chaperonin cofactor prefoldin